MAHEFESGFFSREGAWHGLGTVVAGEQTWEDAQVLAGLNWDAVKLPTVVDDGAYEALAAILAAKRHGNAEDLDRAIAAALKVGQKTTALAYAMQRTDDGRVIGSVGANYTPFQNRDAFRFMDKVVGDGLAAFHTAGSLMGGRKVWCLCRLPGHLGTDLDPVEKFLLLSTSHDGSKAITVTITPTRVVCWNTLSLAIGQFESGSQSGFRIRHNSNVFERVTDAQRLVAEAEGTLAAFDTKIKQMSLKPFTDDHFRMLTLLLCPPPKDAVTSGKLDDVSTKRQNTWNAMLELFKGGHGQDLPGAKGTAWGALNAVTEYVDHQRRTAARLSSVMVAMPDMVEKAVIEQEMDDRRAENRAESVAWGSGAALKGRALEMVLEYTENGTLPIPTVADGGDLNRLEELVQF